MLRFSDFILTWCENAVSTRILDQWMKYCSLVNEPLLQSKKIHQEFDKRIKQAGTKEAKAKLCLINCDLNDTHIKMLVRTLASNSKISVLDLTGNNKITKEVLSTSISPLI